MKTSCLFIRAIRVIRGSQSLFSRRAVVLKTCQQKPALRFSTSGYVPGETKRQEATRSLDRRLLTKNRVYDTHVSGRLQLLQPGQNVRWQSANGGQAVRQRTICQLVRIFPFGAWDLQLIWNLELGTWNFEPRATAQITARFAPMCTSVHLRAPSCAKTKKSRMLHKPHISAHSASGARPARKNRSKTSLAPAPFFRNSHISCGVSDCVTSCLCAMVGYCGHKAEGCL